MPEGNITKTFNRLAQRAGELVIKGEKTSFPPRTAELIEQIDQMRPWITKIVSATEEYIDINIASKVVEAFHQKNKERTTTTDKLGTAMELVASQSINAAPHLSKMLHDAAEVHQRMATARKAFNNEVDQNFIRDLRYFLNHNLAEAHKAKMKLEDSRLDLDSAKNKLKNAKDDEQRAKWEGEIRRDEAEFDRVQKAAILLFEQTCEEFDQLNHQLLDLIRAERNYYEACAKECNLMLNQ
ncbi:hypothetical protein Aperf_G00000057241 [Anoplocephala perfoliata]